MLQGLAQTESAYFQPTPKGPTPFTIQSAYSDPALPSDGMGWGTAISNSKDILVFGAGLYSWYDVRTFPPVRNRICSELTGLG